MQDQRIVTGKYTQTIKEIPCMHISWWTMDMHMPFVNTNRFGGSVPSCQNLPLAELKIPVSGAV
jgi:hypothetical protein